MTDRELAVPAANPDPVVARLEQMEKWLEGWVDPQGKRHPGLIEMVGVVYEELKLRRERREAIARVMVPGGALALLGFTLNWLKDHLK